MKKFFQKKNTSFVAILSLLLLLTLSPITGLADQSISTKDQNTVETEEQEYTNHEELGQQLEQIVEDSSGKVEVDVLTYTQRDREIYVARVGNGDRVLLIDSEIHGNEKSGTEAILAMLNTLGTDDSEQTQKVLDELTIVAVPKLNADGSELVRRHNDITWEEVIENHPQLEGTDPAWYYNERSEGFDINRDFNPDLTYVPDPEDLPGTSAHVGFYLTKEARGLADLYIELQEEFGEVETYVNLHHMGTPKNEGTNEDVTIALSEPPLGPDNSPKYTKDWPKLDQDKSRRYALAAAIGMNEAAEDGRAPGLSRYVNPDTFDLAGIALGAFGLNGSASVLFEMAGQAPRVGYDQDMVDQVVDGLWGIANHMADGTVNDLDVDDFYAIPKYWPDAPKVSDPAQYSTDFTELEAEQAPENWSPIWQGEDDEWTIKEDPQRLHHVARSGVRGLTSDEVGEIYGSAEVFGLVRASDVQETLFQMGIHMSGAPGSENGIYVDARMPDTGAYENSVRIMQRSAGRDATLGSAELPFTLEEDTWYRVLLQRDSAALQVKIWPDGEEEPAKWQVTVVEDNMYGGKVGVSHSTVGTTTDYAYIGVGIGGERAPHAPDDLIETPEPITASDIKEQVNEFMEEGEFDSDRAARALTTHLEAVIVYEKKEEAEKVVKHMNGFKTLLNNQQDNELISDRAYDVLMDKAKSLLGEWQ